MLPSILVLVPMLSGSGRTSKNPPGCTGIWGCGGLRPSCPELGLWSGTSALPDWHTTVMTTQIKENSTNITQEAQDTAEMQDTLWKTKRQLRKSWLLAGNIDFRCRQKLQGCGLDSGIPKAQSSSLLAIHSITGNILKLNIQWLDSPGDIWPDNLNLKGMRCWLQGRLFNSHFLVCVSSLIKRLSVSFPGYCSWVWKLLYFLLWIVDW